MRFNSVLHCSLTAYSESYGGHYVPAISNKIVSANAGINFAGCAIGNGLVDPLYQVQRTWSRTCDSSSFPHTVPAVCQL